MVHPAIDKMIDDNLFFCPINQVKGDKATTLLPRIILLFPPEQFVDGEAFATNTLHECAHATGAESRLNRDMKHAFGSPEYAKEDLIAELSAAVIASQHGLSKHIKNDSAQYLKSWLGSLREGPEFLKTVLTDVTRCTNMINERLDKIQLEMDKGENAEYSQYRPTHGTGSSQASEVCAAKETQEEKKQTFHRSR